MLVSILSSLYSWKGAIFIIKESFDLRLGNDTKWRENTNTFSLIASLIVTIVDIALTFQSQFGMLQGKFFYFNGWFYAVYEIIVLLLSAKLLFDMKVTQQKIKPLTTVKKRCHFISLSQSHTHSLSHTHHSFDYII